MESFDWFLSQPRVSVILPATPRKKDTPQCPLGTPPPRGTPQARDTKRSISQENKIKCAFSPLFCDSWTFLVLFLRGGVWALKPELQSNRK